MKEREQKKDWGDLPFFQIRRSVVTWEVAFFSTIGMRDSGKQTES